MTHARVGPILALAALVALWAPAVAAGHIFGEIGHDGCSDGSEQCGPKPEEPPALLEEVEETGATASKPPSLLDQAASAVSGAAGAVADAAKDASAAVAAAAVAMGAAIVGALRSYSEFLLQFRPAKMPLPAYAGVAAGATAVAAAGSQATLWYLARKLAPWLALVPGFSRIAKDDLLEHERRARIHEMVKQNPGIRLNEIAKGLDLSWGSCMHHLRKLRADRLITFRQVGHHKCYFLNGHGLSEQEAQAVSLVKGATLQGVAAYIESHAGTTLKELAAGLGISSPLAAFHVSKLERAGLLTKAREGRLVRLSLAAPLPHAHLTPSTLAAPAHAMPVAAA